MGTGIVMAASAVGWYAALQYDSDLKKLTDVHSLQARLLQPSSNHLTEGYPGRSQTRVPGTRGEYQGITERTVICQVVSLEQCGESVHGTTLYPLGV